MTTDWSQYEGDSVAGWRLDSFLGEREGRGFFLTHREGDAQPLWIQLIESGTPASDAVLDSWRRAAELTHPQLLKPRDGGTEPLRGNNVHFAVMDLPDDDLSEVLGKRQPARAEARSIVGAVESALAYLHSRQLSHGMVIPANVFYFGQEIRLSVDSIQDAGGQPGDLRQLEHLREKLGLVQAPGGKRLAIAVGAGLAAVLVAALLFARRAPEPVVQAKPAAAAPQAPVASKRTPFGPPSGPAAGDMVERMAPKARGTAKGQSWGVVAAAYNDFGAAEKFSGRLAQRIPELRPHVEPPEGSGKRYMVVLGTGLSQDRAEELRRRALELGAPRDSYVTKLDLPKGGER